MVREPKQLQEGKKFHKKIQADWEETAQGIVCSEKTVDMSVAGNKKGRMDILVDDDDPNGTAAIVEIKNSDWDKMTDKAVRRNVRRQIRQIVGYLETQLVNGEFVDGGVTKNISLGIIFPRVPKNQARRDLIESWFIEEGIVVVWEDE